MERVDSCSLGGTLGIVRVTFTFTHFYIVVPGLPIT